MNRPQRVHKAVIPAAGLGTRFLPATKAIPKEMLPIVDKPAIQYIVEEAVASGIDEILIVTSPSKNAVADHFDYVFELEQRLLAKGKKKEVDELRQTADMARIQYVRQKEPLGLGHAISCAKHFAGDEPFAVLLGDDVVMARNGEQPALRQCIDAYLKTGTSVVGVQRVAQEAVSKYGIIDPAAGKKSASEASVIAVKNLIEKPDVADAPSNLAILGRYVLTPEIFAAIEKTKPDVRNEIELTDAIRLLLKKQGVHACVFSGRRYDIGSKFGLVEAIIETALARGDLSEETSRLVCRLADELRGQGGPAASAGKAGLPGLKPKPAKKPKTK